MYQTWYIDPNFNIVEVKKHIRANVRNVVYPHVENFIQNRINWKRLNLKEHRDSVSFLYDYLKRDPIGKRIIKTVKSELPIHFSKSDIIDTFVHFIYKMDIDVLTIEIIETIDDSVSFRKSLWDKLSEKGHV